MGVVLALSLKIADDSKTNDFMGACLDYRHRLNKVGRAVRFISAPASPVCVCIFHSPENNPPCPCQSSERARPENNTAQYYFRAHRHCENRPEAKVLLLITRHVQRSRREYVNKDDPSSVLTYNRSTAKYFVLASSPACPRAAGK